jgi:hypothetical protein
MKNLLLGLLAATLSAPSAAANPNSPGPEPLPWGYDGHRIICDIAYRNLDEDVRNEVDDLLSGDPEEAFRDFREACTWADEIRSRREAAYDTFTTAHYVNIEPGSSGLDLSRDCGHTFCVVEAIVEQSLILADTTADRSKRRDALKFVGHFVGDIHQPLHVHGRGKGGNDVRVLVNGENYSLHSFWDTGFLIRRGGEWQRVARGLGYGISPIDRAVWANLDPVVWADESFRIAEDRVYVFPLSAEVQDEYYFRNIQTVEEQLQRAGLRLALLLNDILGQQG